MGADYLRCSHCAAFGRSEWDEHGLQRQDWDPTRAAQRFRDAAGAVLQRW